MDATNYVLGLAVSLIIMYVIIQCAVKAATKDLLKQIRLMNKLKIEEMKRNGFDREEVNALVDMMTEDKGKSK